MKLTTVIVSGLLIGAAAFAADAGAELFQKAVTQERAAGNLEEAIKLYQRVAKEFASDRALAAKALVAEAKCYEKLGQDRADKATKLYEQVAHDYRDQSEQAATASARLVVLRQATRAATPPPPATMTQRKIDLPSGIFSAYQTDGQRKVTFDKAANSLMMADLASGAKHVIYKFKEPVTGSFIMASRDFSELLMYVHRPDKSTTYLVVKADGTGFREVAGDWNGDWPCIPDFSWDNRSLLLCHRQAEAPPQRMMVSLADGEVHRIRDAGGYYYRFSPDGRFIAYDGYGLDGPRTFVVPTAGGDPQIVSTKARFLDWTRDGRYLIANGEDLSGTEALYLLPVKNGEQAGDPVLIRYGAFHYSRTAASGALIYAAEPGFTSWLGTPGPADGSLAWEKLSLAGTGMFATWSPDSTRIAYVAGAAQSGGPLRVRNVASGEERELYRLGLGFCHWASQHPNIFCMQMGTQKRAELMSISTETGRAESLGTVPGDGLDGPPLFLARDDHAFFFGTTRGLARWEIGATESTMVTEIPNFGPREQMTAMASPDGRWVTRWVNPNLEIRPTSGGDWRPLAEVGNVSQAAFTPDGNWLVYNGSVGGGFGKDGLYRVATAGGQPERLGDAPPASSRGEIYISPDGQKILVVALGSGQELWMLENFEPKQQTVK